MQLSRHPLWLVGFRPFFSLACVAGVLFPLLWAMLFAGRLSLLDLPVGPIAWHAHEMFFGFGWAVLGGFLLTSTKNWVGIRGYHGPTLMALAAAWLVERVAMSFGASWPWPLFVVASNLFLGSIVFLLVWTLVAHRDRDTYRDNAIFVVMLPAFLVAKNLMLSETGFTAGYGMALALFRLAFLVMLERTLTQFMRAAFQVEILRHPGFDMPIKLLGLALVAAPWLPAPLAADLALALAALMLVRLAFWKPLLACRRIDIGVMYVGYVAIAAQLALAGLARWIDFAWIGSVPVHVFTFGAMGAVIPAMIVRIAKGHTGRKVVFDAFDRAVLYAMLAGLAVRVGLPQLWPAHYLAWIALAAACWTAAFGTLAVRYIPLLMQPRIDGREH